MHTEFRRHRLDADLGRAGVDDDRAGARPVLWRHGAQEECRRHRNDELCRDLPRHHPVRGLHVQHGVSRRLTLHRRARPHVPQGHPERHRQGRHRQSQSAGRDHSGSRLHLLPDDVRHHYAGADRGRLCRAHEVLGHAVVHRAVGDLRLRADRALGLGTGRHLQLRQRCGLGESARLRRRHGRAYQRGRGGADVRHHAWASARTAGRHTTWC